MRADQNLRVLLYAGDTDLACAYLGVKQVAKDVRWEGFDAFRKRADRPESEWTQLRDEGRKVYGNVVQVGRFMYARIYGAGHMVNEKRPAESKEMFEKWVGQFVFDPPPPPPAVETTVMEDL